MAMIPSAMGQGPGLSMPAAVPGFGGPPPGPGGAPGMPIGGPPGGAPMGLGMMPTGMDPASQQYTAVTQADGSILLHTLNPDGSLGPAVKIINPIKPRQAGAAPM